MTDEELKAIREEWEATTPGRWRAGVNDTDTVFCPQPGAQVVDGVCCLEEERVLLRANPHWESEADIIFTANAHQYVPALLAEVVRLKEENARLTRYYNQTAWLRMAAEVEVDEYD